MAQQMAATGKRPRRRQAAMRAMVPGRIWQHECDGWYIYSNISNGTKKDDLLRISDYHHLGLKVEEGKPE